jgi:hypothetical protein
MKWENVSHRYVCILSLWERRGLFPRNVERTHGIRVILFRTWDDEFEVISKLDNSLPILSMILNVPRIVSNIQNELSNIEVVERAIEGDNVQISLLAQVCRLTLIRRWTSGALEERKWVSTVLRPVISLGSVVSLSNGDILMYKQLKSKILRFLLVFRFLHVISTSLSLPSLLKRDADSLAIDLTDFSQWQYPSFLHGFWDFPEANSFTRTFFH